MVILSRKNMKQCKCLLQGCYVTINVQNLYKSCSAAQSLERHLVMYRRSHHRSWLSVSSNCSKLKLFFKCNSHTSEAKKQTCMELSKQKQQQYTLCEEGTDRFHRLSNTGLQLKLKNYEDESQMITLKKHADIQMICTVSKMI